MYIYILALGERKRERKIYVIQAIRKIGKSAKLPKCLVTGVTFVIKAKQKRRKPNRLPHIDTIACS